MAGSSVAPLVGRSTELGRVLAALNRADAGTGGTMLLAGEPGIGKTRLATEALAVARRCGFETVHGAAFPLQADLAYAPVLEALGPFLGGLDPGRLALLVRGLPDLGRMFGGLHLPPPEPLGDAAVERTRLFEAVSRLVGRIAEQQPLALLIDDLHWADASSIELLHYLARGLGTRRVLLIGTYRRDEARDHPRLRTMIRSLQRLGLVDDLLVGALGPEPVAALARALLGGEPPVELLAALHDRAAGTPLFVAASIQGLRDDGVLRLRDGKWVLTGGSTTSIPPVVRDLVVARLERLDPMDRALLETIAVAGDAASPMVLARVGALAPDEFEGALGRLCESGLIAEVAEPDLTYRASHPLVAEVAYEQLPTIRRRRRHAQVARALEALEPVSMQRLAHHYLGAGGEVDAARALDVLVEAARQSGLVHADAEAAEQLTAAVALARAVRPTLVDELLERLGIALSRAGRPDAAVAAWSEAAGGRELAGDGQALARLRGSLALTEWDRGRFDEAAAQLAAGFAAVEGTGADAELMELSYIRLRLLARQVDLAHMEKAATNLLTLAERSGRTQETAVVAAHLARAETAFVRGQLMVAGQHGLRALAVAERAGRPALAADAHRYLAVIAISAGDHDTARRHARAELALAEQIGSPTQEATARFLLVALDLTTDVWDGALRGADDLLAMSTRIGTSRGVAAALACRSIVAAYQGRLEEAARCVAQAREVYTGGVAADRHLFTVVEVADATVALTGGDPERAGALATAALATPISLPCLALTILGESRVAVGDPAGALDIARTLVELGPDAPWPVACGEWVEGLARAALDDPVAALGCLERAADRSERLGLPFQAARAWLGWAEVAAALPAPNGDVTAGRLDAAGAARRSQAAFDRLGARPFADRARKLLRAVGERPSATVRATTGTLSDRELEVVRLVAAGLSNTEIAGRLFISPRTVTTHLQHVYRRLGLPSRTALTRWALERGLLGPDT